MEKERRKREIIGDDRSKDGEIIEKEASTCWALT